MISLINTHPNVIISIERVISFWNRYLVPTHIIGQCLNIRSFLRASLSLLRKFIICSFSSWADRFEDVNELDTILSNLAGKDKQFWWLRNCFSDVYEQSLKTTLYYLLYPNSGNKHDFKLSVINQLYTWNIWPHTIAIPK